MYCVCAVLQFTKLAATMQTRGPALHLNPEDILIILNLIYFIIKFTGFIKWNNIKATIKTHTHTHTLAVFIKTYSTHCTTLLYSNHTQEISG